MNERGERGSSNRLRFEEETREDLTSGQLGPKSERDPSPTDKPKNRLRFKDKDVPDGGNLPDDSPTEDTPTTSGQVGPKLKQGGKFRQDDEMAKPSDRLRRDGESPPPDGEATPGNGGKKPKADKKAVQDKKRLEKSKHRMEQTGDTLDAAQEKLAAQKPLKRPGLIKGLGNAAKFQTWKFVHGKIREVEHENVGTESAHKTELAGEGVVRGTSRFIKRRYRTRHSRRVRKLTKRNVSAKADYAYRKLVEENPELKKKTVTRMIQKYKIKRQYQKQAREAAKHGKKAVGITAKISRAVVTFVKSNPKVMLIALVFFLLLFILQSCTAMVMSIGNGILGAVVGTSYLAEDADIDEAALRYTEWETDLQLRINNAERDYPGYDEYRYNVADISHNPFELIAFLTAVYDDFTFSSVQGVLQQIFNEQYNLTFTPEVEIRYRTETRTGSYTDSQGNSHSYTYTVEVPYEYHILNINLTAQSFTSIIFPRMNAAELERFNIYMITKGNRQYLQSPFGDLNWLPFVSSYYGYRVHPISGEKDLHRGLDIALPTGTEILAGQAGTVTFAGDSGGYGLLVVLDNGEGLVSKYAHCSALLVSVGQTVEAGQPIAKVGNTGTSTGPHLHLEIFKDGRYLNPLFFTVTNDYSAGPTFSENPGASMGDGSLAALIAEAEKHLGKPYVYGANGPNAFDCSSFVCWVYTHSGVYNMPRTTAQGIFNQTTPISPSEAQPGDIIFFTGTYSTPSAVSHVGIYVGNGMMIHAGSPIQYTSINTPYWQNHFYSFGRVPTN